MATTTYSSAWKQNAFGVGTPSARTLYEPIPIPMERAGLVYTAYSQITVPVGYTTGDILKLIPYQTSVSTASPQIQGIRQARIILKCAGDVGGSVTVNFGFAATGSATAYGSALTTLQSANTTEIAVATVLAGSTLLTNDDLQLVAAAGTSTTARLVECWVQAFMQAP
jgi:hypothetical protein